VLTSRLNPVVLSTPSWMLGALGACCAGTEPAAAPVNIIAMTKEPLFDSSRDSILHCCG
jgi:hypothetical protein